MSPDTNICVNRVCHRTVLVTVPLNYEKMRNDDVRRDCAQRKRPRQTMTSMVCGSGAIPRGRAIKLHSRLMLHEAVPPKGPWNGRLPKAINWSTHPGEWN